MRNRKSRNVNGVSVRDRMIARIMVLILTVSMMPYQALAAGTAETKRVKSVEDKMRSDCLHPFRLASKREQGLNNLKRLFRRTSCGKATMTVTTPAFMSWRPGLRMKTWSMKICPSHM